MRNQDLITKVTDLYLEDVPLTLVPLTGESEMETLETVERCRWSTEGLVLTWYW